MESLSQNALFSSFKELGAMLDVYPEVVINAEGINGVFDKEGSGNRVQNIKQLTRYDLKYDRLELKILKIHFSWPKAVYLVMSRRLFLIIPDLKLYLSLG